MIEGQIGTLSGFAGPVPGVSGMEWGMRRVPGFFGDDAGAITVDWVALTAGILLLGVTVVYSIFNGGVGALTVSISGTLSSAGAGVDVGPAPALNGGSGAVTATDPRPIKEQCSHAFCAI
jgi:hypothetical protein